MSSVAIWWHYLHVIVPSNYERNDLAFYFIDGGKINNSGFNSALINAALTLSLTFNAISAVIMQVPNQPIVFKVSFTRVKLIHPNICSFEYVLLFIKSDPLARSLCNIESVIGQLYPATLLARLVTLELSSTGSARRPTSIT